MVFVKGWNISQNGCAAENPTKVLPGDRRSAAYGRAATQLQVQLDRGGQGTGAAAIRLEGYPKLSLHNGPKNRCIDIDIEDMYMYRCI